MRVFPLAAYPVLWAGLLLSLIFSAPCTLRAQVPDLGLNLPSERVSRRSSLVTRIPANSRRTYAEMSGPGCIRHIWVGHSLRQNWTRNLTLRIYFDDEPVPYVEAPLGDFFGVMHGQAWYPINTPFLSVQADGGYNCYFPMPFARSARVEISTGDQDEGVYCQISWHEYPAAEFQEPRRFCARWRRENPTQRYGEDFLMLDADGPGRLLGFVYGVRLLDNVDRWSHGGAENIYLDGEGRYPSLIRGIGGEDSFGTAYGGSVHIPTTHLYASMPFYQQFDDGTPRPAKNLTGYRWYVHDAIHFRESVQMRFGSMSNDICSTVYWYQQRPVRPFFKLPPHDKLAAGLREAPQVPRGEYDLALPDSGSWWLSDVLDEAALTVSLAEPLSPDAVFAASSLEQQGWKERPAMHGFVDFGHVRRPHRRGAGVFHEGTARARCLLHVERDTTATIRIGWDDQLVLRVNQEPPQDMGRLANFGSAKVSVPLQAGRNRIELTLANTRNFNHGGWAFSFSARSSQGERLIPQSR